MPVLVGQSTSLVQTEISHHGAQRMKPTDFGDALLANRSKFFDLSDEN